MSLEKYEQLRLEGQICFPLYAASKEVIRKYKQYLEELDLTYTQYIVMMVMWDKKQMNVKELLKKNCYGNPEKITFDKFKEGDAALERRELIFRNWDRIRHLLKGQIFSYAETRRLLQEAKAPVNPREIGLDKEQFYHGLFTAQLIRARYTFLDLLYEAGLLEEAAKTLDIMFEE